MHVHEFTRTARRQNDKHAIHAPSRAGPCRVASRRGATARVVGPARCGTVRGPDASRRRASLKTSPRSPEKGERSERGSSRPPSSPSLSLSSRKAANGVVLVEETRSVTRKRPRARESACKTTGLRYNILAPAKRSRRDITTAMRIACRGTCATRYRCAFGLGRKRRGRRSVRRTEEAAKGRGR